MRRTLAGLLLACGAAWAAPVNPDLGLGEDLANGVGLWRFARNQGPFSNIPGGLGIGEAYLADADGVVYNYDGVDGAGILRVNGTPYASPNPADFYVDPTGPIYTGAPLYMDDLIVWSQFYAPNSTPWMRVAAFVANPTFSPITANFQLHNNSGADEGMAIEGSSSGDTTFGTDDRWVVTDDSIKNGNDPAVVYSLYGPGSPLAPTSANGTGTTTYFQAAGNQGIVGGYDVTIQPAEFILFVWYIGLAHTPAEGMAIAAELDTLTPNHPLMYGFQPGWYPRIVNWDFDEPGGGTTEAPEPASIALVGAGLVLAGMARRRARRRA